MKKLKKVSIHVFIGFVLTVGILGAYNMYYKGNVQAYSMPTSGSTRIEQAEELISELAKQRKTDLSFIEETKKMQKELEESRNRQARLDALMIVQTQLDMEIDTIKKQQAASK